MPQPIEELDALPAGAFIEALAPLFEGSPELLRRLAGDRPFGSWWNLLARARAIAQAMPEADQIELLNAHPRLGAPPETVSRLSFGEQGYGRAGDNPAQDADDRPLGSLGERPLPPSTFAAPAAEQTPVPLAPPPSRPAMGSSIGLRSRIQAASTPPAEPPRWGSAANAGAAPRPALPSASSTPQANPPPATPQAPAPAPSTPAPDDAETTRERLGRLNDAYEDWFGFRYCVFVAGRPLEALVPELEAAMSRPRGEELKRGVDAVIDIAIARSGAAR